MEIVLLQNRIVSSGFLSSFSFDSIFEISLLPHAFQIFRVVQIWNTRIRNIYFRTIKKLDISTFPIKVTILHRIRPIVSGDLTSNVTETGLGELHAKRVVRQLAAAVHHIHSRELVHRDIKLDNILVFRSDFSRIKLCDFGETRRVNTVVRRHNEWLPYSPPEVLQIDTDETYK